ncbi:MAG: hypothetical protein MI748_02570 [Opitutales bacterium]|nr:hypothetical protein [Opitutales bacterium]
MNDFLRFLLRGGLILAAFGLSMRQVNSLAAVGSLYFPALWVYAYFPAFKLPWKQGFLLVLLSGIVIETQIFEFRGLLIPALILTHVWMRYESSKPDDFTFAKHLWFASFAHLFLVVWLTLLHMTRGDSSIGYVGVRFLQDWLCGQLLVLPLVFLLGYKMDRWWGYREDFHSPRRP